MAAMASLAAVAASTTSLVSPVSLSFSGLRPMRPLAHAAFPRLHLARSRHARSFSQGIRASADGAPADDATFDGVRSVIAEQLALLPEKITPESTFSDLGADSLDTVEIMMALEEKFNIQLEEQAGEKIETVSHAVDLIKEVIRSK